MHACNSSFCAMRRSDECVRHTLFLWTLVARNTMHRSCLLGGGLVGEAADGDYDRVPRRSRVSAHSVSLSSAPATVAPCIWRISSRMPAYSATGSIITRPSGSSTTVRSSCPGSSFRHALTAGEREEPSPSSAATEQHATLGLYLSGVEAVSKLSGRVGFDGMLLRT